MPIYEYRCDNGHTLEVMQRMSDDPLASCTTCAAPVQRVFHPVAVHFKGSGFYSTDYRSNNSKGGDDATGAGDPGDSSKAATDGSKPASKSEGSDAKPKGSDSKPKAGSSEAKPSG